MGGSYMLVYTVVHLVVVSDDRFSLCLQPVIYAPLPDSLHPFADSLHVHVTSDCATTMPRMVVRPWALGSIA
jgi:hypothetical protein